MDKFSKTSSEKTYFGYQQVAVEEKSTLVKEVFSSVASKYDLMNNLMSFGLHHIWKSKLLALMPSKGNLIDVAGGTGDIAYGYYKKNIANPKETRIIVCDINQQMLEEGQARLINKNILSGIEFVQADAENLPFEDKIFDYYTISFGIRNVTNIEAALKEAYRVLKPGGKFLCLEFSHVDNSFLKEIYDFYSFNIIPNLGGIIADNKEAYRYLVESIRKFPTASAFSELITSVGFKKVKYEKLTCGVTAIHCGYRIL